MKWLLDFFVGNRYIFAARTFSAAPGYCSAAGRLLERLSRCAKKFRIGNIPQRNFWLLPKKYFQGFQYVSRCQEGYIYIYIYYQRKFRNLTSDYTESCCWRSVNCQPRDVIQQRCDTAEMCDMRIWQVRIARNAVFFNSWLRWLGRSAPKNGRARRTCCPIEAGKICTTSARESDLEVKIVKNWGRGSIFGRSRRRKICTKPARESDSEVKIVKHKGPGTFFEVHKMFFAWKEQEFRHSILINFANTYCNSEAKRLLNIPYFREVSQHSLSQSVTQSISQLVTQSVS